MSELSDLKRQLQDEKYKLITYAPIPSQGAAVWHNQFIKVQRLTNQINQLIKSEGGS